MRLIPSRLMAQKPISIKRQVANLRHISAPLKGLSLSSKLDKADPLTATILDNWIVEEHQITCRPGSSLVYTYTDTSKSFETMVPYYGQPDRLAGAIDGKLVTLDGSTVGSGFLSNDWSWTAFTDLGTDDYTVMVNGIDGVWSWDGGATVTEETVTAPAAETWVVPDQLNIVLAHLNRLWFADSTNLAVYYLPLQQKSGELKVWPLNAVFKRGGSIRAMYTWTTDGGINMNDQLVIFSTNGECVMLAGVDPASDMYVSGLYRFDAPLSKHSVINYGGDLYVLISTGLVPMTTLMRAEEDQLRASDRNVVTDFFKASFAYRSRPGWQAFINPSSGRVYCNMPLGSKNSYRQMVRNMPNPVWSTWSNLPARCWGWVAERVFFGSDDGKIYEISPTFLNDAGQPIRVDVQPAWSNFGTPASKHFKMVQPYIRSDGTPHVFIDMKLDYDMSPPTNQPDVTFADTGSAWDEATWDVDSWAADALVHNSWSGVAGLSHVVAAPRTVALVKNARFSLSGWDVLFETGSIFG